MDQFLLAMCGIPSSGKSHLASVILQQIHGKLKAEIVSTDDWRNEEFYADFTPENERRVRKDALIKTKELIERGISVIHDDTNYYTSMRHELYEIAMDGVCVFAIVYVSTPVETALQWNVERGSPIPEEVILRISERFDKPGSKYAWDMAIASVDMTTESAYDSTLKIVEKLYLLTPPEMKSSEVGVASSSDTLLDVVTRQVVSRFLEAHPKYRKDRRVSKVRRDVLGEARGKGYTADDVERILAERLKNLADQIA